MTQPASKQVADSADHDLENVKVEFTKHVQPGQVGSSRLNYIIIGLLLLLAGLGGGFGIGWATRKAVESDGDGSKSPNTIDNAGLVASNVDLLLPYAPLSVSANASNAAVQQHYEQWSVITPALYAFSVVVSALGNTSFVFDAPIFRSYMANKYGTDSNEMAQLYNIAQRIQVTPAFQSKIFNVTNGLLDVFNWVRDTPVAAASGGGMAGRRALLQQPLYLQLLKQALQEAMNNGPLKPAKALLTQYYSFDSISDLLLDIFQLMQAFASDITTMADLANKHHGDPETTPALYQVNVVDANTNTTSALGIIPLPYIREAFVAVGEGEDDAGSGAVGLRRLLDTVPLPTGFVARPPEELPNLLVPIVFHILMYQNTDGSYGPPGVSQASTMVARLMQQANMMSAPSRFQFYVKELRNDPTTYPYLLLSGRDRWLYCSSAFTYDICGDFLRPSAVDFPRTINIYVVGEGPPADWTGYAFAPGSSSDPFYGHIALTWPMISTDGNNNKDSYESGAATLWHEIMHHLGMVHTFADASDCITDDNIADTPKSKGPVWQQTFAMKAYMACLNTFTTTLKSDWARLNTRWSTTSSIPTEDRNSFADSCVDNQGPDELGNWITYSYDICFAALGHLTAGQVQAMHKITFSVNPQLYNWAQYTAKNPPAAANPSPITPPPPSPPPPSVVASPPPPTTSAIPAPVSCSVRAPTVQNCKCKTTWNYKGKDYNGCVQTSGEAVSGYWCAIERDGDCVSARNGWWDYCTPIAAAATTACAPAPQVSPPTPIAGPAPVTCGNGATTRDGYSCAKKWADAAGNQYVGCANPNSDPNGVWCVLAKNQATQNGSNWDYCDVACNALAPKPAPAPPSPPPPPPASPNITLTGNTVRSAKIGCSDATGLPVNCKCKTLWAFAFANGGNTYTNNQGCAAFPEDLTRSFCQVEGCRLPKNNNQFFNCSCSVSAKTGK